MASSTKVLMMAAAAATLSMLAATSAHADVLAAWNFNNTTYKSSMLNPFLTSGTAEVYDAATKTLTTASAGVYASTAKVDFSALAGTMGDGSSGGSNGQYGAFSGPNIATIPNDTAFSLLGTNNNGKYVTFTLATSGYEGLTMTYDTRGSGTGFANQVWSYSTDGTTWVDVDTKTGRNLITTFTNVAIDFSSIADVNNLDTLYVRVTFSGATGSAGNNRLDNVTFSANAVGAEVPEPATIGALGLGGLMLLARRRKA